MEKSDLRTRTLRRAFEIWEAEGRPEGRALTHWLRAEAECVAARAPKPSRTRRDTAANPKVPRSTKPAKRR